MARPTTHSLKTYLSLKPFELAVIAYYAQQTGLERPEVMRKVIRAFVMGDTELSLKAFRDYVLGEFSKELTDKEQRDALKQDLEKFQQRRATPAKR